MSILKKLKQFLSEDKSLQLNPRVNLPAEEYLLLLVSCFEAAQNHAYLNTYATGLTKLQLDSLVHQHWGIKDKQGALEILNQLLKRNRNRNLKAIYVAYQIEDYPDYLKFNLHEGEEAVVKQYIAYLDGLKKEVPILLEKGIFTDYAQVLQTEDAGWNLGRGAFLIRACVDLEFLTTQEAQVLFQRFYDELTTHCQTWEDYTASYILGARLEGWLSLEELLTVRTHLLTAKNSPLKTHSLLKA